MTPDHVPLPYSTVRIPRRRWRPVALYAVTMSLLLGSLFLHAPPVGVAVGSDWGEETVHELRCVEVAWPFLRLAYQQRSEREKLALPLEDEGTHEENDRWRSHPDPLPPREIRFMVIPSERHFFELNQQPIFWVTPSWFWLTWNNEQQGTLRWRFERTVQVPVGTWLLLTWLAVGAMYLARALLKAFRQRWYS